MTVLPELSFQEISQYFHLPISQAAKELKVCETLLKKICRVNGIKRWPHRKIRSIDTMINLLEFRIQSEKLPEKEKNRMRSEISDLIEKKSFFMSSPNTTYQSIIPKNTLQSFSKTKLKNQKSFNQFLHEEAKKPQSNNVITNTISSMTAALNSGAMGTSVIVSNLRSKSKRKTKERYTKIDDDDDEDYIEEDDGEFDYANYRFKPREMRRKQKSNQIVEENNSENLEKEEEEVLNVLTSLAVEKKKSLTPSSPPSLLPPLTPLTQINFQRDLLNNQPIIENKNNNNEVIMNNNQMINNNTINNNNNASDQGSNELYKLSLLAILNPLSNDDKNAVNNNNKNDNIKNDNENNSKNRVNELKMRNILRRSMENIDDNNNNNNAKKRKFDYKFQTNLEYTSDTNNNNNPPQYHHFSPTKLITL